MEKYKREVRELIWRMAVVTDKTDTPEHETRSHITELNELYTNCVEKAIIRRDYFRRSELDIPRAPLPALIGQIGRASCRERV